MKKRWYGVMSLVSMLVLVGVLGLGAAMPSLAAPPASPQAGSGLDGQPSLLNVTGTGTATAAPDVVRVRLGVDVRNASAGEAVAESTDRMTKVMDAITALGIEDEDVRTVSYRVWVEEDRDREGNLTGERIYHVANEVQVTLRDLEVVGDLLEGTLDAGANTVGGINFAIEDPKALQSQARELAMADAKDRAAELAEGLGVTLGKPYTISEYGNAMPVERAMMVMDAPAYGIGGGGSVPISSGEYALTVEVAVAWSIE